MNEKREFKYEANGVTHYNHEYLAAKLLEEDVLFLNSRKFVEYGSIEAKDETLVLFLNCNDVFIWGCADGESVTMDELPVLFELFELNNTYGPVKWVCIKRNEKPQKPLADQMKAADFWDEEMEKLPDNYYDKWIAEQKVDKVKITT